MIVDRPALMGLHRHCGLSRLGTACRGSAYEENELCESGNEDVLMKLSTNVKL